MSISIHELLLSAVISFQHLTSLLLFLFFVIHGGFFFVFSFFFCFYLCFYDLWLRFSNIVHYVVFVLFALFNPARAQLLSVLSLLYLRSLLSVLRVLLTHSVLRLDFGRYLCLLFDCKEPHFLSSTRLILKP